MSLEAQPTLLALYENAPSGSFVRKTDIGTIWHTAVKYSVSPALMGLRECMMH